MNTEEPGDPERDRLRERLEAVLVNTEKAAPWGAETRRLQGLINREGYVQVSAKLAREDLLFLSTAREELLALASLGLRLLELHRPRDAGGITSDTRNPILRCRSCMWRWPCPTYRAIRECFGDRTPYGSGTGTA
ncbi:hypothetical protein [Bailinhaonella thermotolerans]|uniref:Uncharacterized protein n=1 Tax=Bailinhaonella thermotolerans TaxID=1070861 RepID=A0A3A4AUJ0_9ACTN|nr:hypothetical protein [Bailinhaonella thermotolerans]RJL32289.1 hypothetical protein D5H75_17615 [Bailinhaonella thermotolerans]